MASGRPDFSIERVMKEPEDMMRALGRDSRGGAVKVDLVKSDSQNVKGDRDVSDKKGDDKDKETDRDGGAGGGDGDQPPSDDDGSSNGSDDQEEEEEEEEQEEEGGEEETESEDYPTLDELRADLNGIKEQMKDLSVQKWKVEELIVKHYPNSKDAKDINRRKNANASRANSSSAVADVKNTLITLYVKKDDATVEYFRVRLSMSGGKFIGMVEDRFNVKKSKFYITCPNGDVLQGGNRTLFGQGLKPDNTMTISFRGAGGAKRVKTQMKTEHKITRLQAKLRADNRQCEQTEIDTVVSALEGVKKFLVDGVDVQALLNDASIDTLKAVLTLTPRGETGRSAMNKLEDMAKELIDPLKHLGNEISTIKDIYADVFHTLLDDYAGKYNNTTAKDATLNHRDFQKAVEDVIEFKEKAVQNQMNTEKHNLEQKLRSEFEAKLQNHLASMAKAPPSAPMSGDVSMGTS